MSVRALFLDRDGVVVGDDGRPGARARAILPGTAAAIREARAAGYRIIVVTNQTAVARGLLTEDEVRAEHARLGAELAREGALVDAFYYCPHHPNATLPQYRVACDCRKPRPGMLRAAAAEHGLDLAASVMIGDRPSDVAAGRRAGCRTVLVESGMHLAPPIESPDDFGDARPDATAVDLAAAVRALLGGAG